MILITYADYARDELEALRAHGSSTSTRRNRVIDEASARLDAELRPADAGEPASDAPGPARPGPFDVLVLGAGVAGLSAAVRLAAPGGRSPALPSAC